jgi:hypothetical protein
MRSMLLLALLLIAACESSTGPSERTVECCGEFLCYQHTPPCPDGTRQTTM